MAEHDENHDQTPLDAEPSTAPGGDVPQDPRPADDAAPAGPDLPAAEPTPAAAAGGGDAIPFSMPSLDRAQAGERRSGLDLLNDVNLNVTIELGRTRMLVEDVLRLGDGCVVELDKLAGDPVDVYVNERLVARGEVLVLNDNFCVRINEIVPSEEPQRKRA